MADTKITKKDFFNAIKAMVGTVDTVGDIPSAAVVEFIDTQIAQLDAKAEKAKAKAADKKAEGDALRADVKAVLTAELQTRDEIFANFTGVGREDVTVAKIGARLTQLVASGDAVKEQVKTEDGRKVMAYRLA